MARPMRIEYERAVYHVTSRGNERKAVFRNDSDRKTFLDVLKQVTTRYNIICHSYCLMKNHYHIPLETPSGNLSKGMRQLNGVYTQAFNRQHKRGEALGTLLPNLTNFMNYMHGSRLHSSEKSVKLKH